MSDVLLIRDFVGLPVGVIGNCRKADRWHDVPCVLEGSLTDRRSRWWIRVRVECKKLGFCESSFGNSALSAETLVPFGDPCQQGGDGARLAQGGHLGGFCYHSSWRIREAGKKTVAEGMRTMKGIRRLESGFGHLWNVEHTGGNSSMISNLLPWESGWLVVLF